MPPSPKTSVALPIWLASPRACFGAGRLIIGQRVIEPGAGNDPVSLGSDRRYVQARGSLLDRQACEVTELHQFSLQRLLLRELV